MAYSLPHTDSEVEALVQKLIDEDKGHQNAILDLALQFENSCTAKDNLRKAYEKCTDISQESRALIDTFLKKGSDKDYELNLSMYGKAAKLEKQIDANSARVEPSSSTSNPIRIIPGPAGLVQQAKQLKEKVFILDSDGALMSTQEYMQKVVEDVDEDDDFNSGASISAINYVISTSGTVTGCLGDINNFLKKEKLDQVVAIVKSCSPNYLGDLNVIMKDLSGTVRGTIHYKVLDVGSYRKDITVGVAMILANVSVFTPKTSEHYLNITKKIVIKSSECEDIMNTPDRCGGSISSDGLLETQPMVVGAATGRLHMGLSMLHVPSTVEEQPILRAIKEECCWESLPIRLQASLVTKEEWHRRLPKNCVKDGRPVLLNVKFTGHPWIRNTANELESAS
ncbi:hypothetical protein Tco_0138388 [Tanacetum coccineum]